MHDKPQPTIDSATAANPSLDRLIANLEASDPADAPDIADDIAARLEAALAEASSRDGLSRESPEGG